MAKRRKFTQGVNIKAWDLQAIGLTDEERIFCFLHAICGIPAAKAYHSAYKGCRAQLISCAPYACRKLQEPAIIAYIKVLYQYHHAGQLEFNEAAIKGW